MKIEVVSFIVWEYFLTIAHQLPFIVSYPISIIFAHELFQRNEYNYNRCRVGHGQTNGLASC